jgi:hypothetical protein
MMCVKKLDRTWIMHVRGDMGDTARLWLSRLDAEKMREGSKLRSLHTIDNQMRLVELHDAILGDGG